MEDLGALRLAADELGFALLRNNSGAWRNPSTGQWTRYGLGNTSERLCRVWKSSDLIGIGPQGRFLAVEVKPSGWTWQGTDHEHAQSAFHDWVRHRGGLAGFATCRADLERILRDG